MSTSSLDYLDTLPDRILEAKKKVEELVRYYHELQKMDIPDSIISVSDEVDKETELLVPKIDTDTLKLWRKRMVKVESVNAVLRGIEDSVVYDFTVSNNSILAKELHKVLRVFEWLLGHADMIKNVGQLACDKADEKYGAGILDGIVGFFIHLGLGDFSGANDARREIASDVDRASSFIAECIMGSVAISAVETMMAGFSIEKFKEKIEPILTIKSKAEADIMSMAFPMGRSGRARRKKAHRVRR